MASAFDQPNMIAARKDLNDANASLRKTTADKGGHRNSAMNLVSRAINAVNDAIAYDRNHQTPGERRKRNSDSDETAFSSPLDQPHMRAANDRLQDALNHLQRATADKGGHRARAMDLVRDAIAEVNKGIEFDRKN